MSLPRTGKWLPHGLLVTGMLLAPGCASTPQTTRLSTNDSRFVQPVELTEVPFFPQEAYQCGPAALATVLTSAGASVTPEALAPQVYLPQRKGSLQFELLAATRRHGYVPYVLKPRLDHLLDEVAAGNPVLVLQNLGLSWYPKWHYAVVVGFDLSKRKIILRSGRRARHTISLKVFERTWKRGGLWAIVSMPPNRLPHTADETRYVRAIPGLERLRRWRDAATAYTTALARWPNNLVAQIGLGNSRYALGDLQGAETAYRQATRDHPNAGPAFNNLAQVLADQGQLQEAENAARQAVRLGGPLLERYEETLQQIMLRQRDTNDRVHNSRPDADLREEKGPKTDVSVTYRLLARPERSTS
ncbi:MAG: PA2778 family cysteine peptidase [Acidiferrobacterales bacterium]